MASLRRNVAVTYCLAVITALLLHPACGFDPSYTECKPHIDATIRDLAAIALKAGENPDTSNPEAYGNVVTASAEPAAQPPPCQPASQQAYDSVPQPQQHYAAQQQQPDVQQVQYMAAQPPVSQEAPQPPVPVQQVPPVAQPPPPPVQQPLPPPVQQPPPVMQEQPPPVVQEQPPVIQPLPIQEAQPQGQQPVYQAPPIQQAPPIVEQLPPPEYAPQQIPPPEYVPQQIPPPQYAPQQIPQPQYAPQQIPPPVAQAPQPAVAPQQYVQQPEIPQDDDDEEDDVHKNEDDDDDVHDSDDNDDDVHDGDDNDDDEHDSDDNDIDNDVDDNDDKDVVGDDDEDDSDDNDADDGVGKNDDEVDGITDDDDDYEDEDDEDNFIPKRVYTDDDDEDEEHEYEEDADEEDEEDDDEEENDEDDDEDEASIITDDEYKILMKGIEGKSKKEMMAYLAEMLLTEDDVKNLQNIDPKEREKKIKQHKEVVSNKNLNRIKVKDQSVVQQENDNKIIKDTSTKTKDLPDTERTQNKVKTEERQLIDNQQEKKKSEKSVKLLNKKSESNVKDTKATADIKSPKMKDTKVSKKEQSKNDEKAKKVAKSKQEITFTEPIKSKKKLQNLNKINSPKTKNIDENIKTNTIKKTVQVLQPEQRPYQPTLQPQQQVQSPPPVQASPQMQAVPPVTQQPLQPPKGSQISTSSAKAKGSKKKEEKKLPQRVKVKAPNYSDKSSIQSPAIFDSFIQIIFGYEEKTRDLKFKKPWRTHPEFQSFDKRAPRLKQSTNDDKNGLFDLFVKIVFNLDTYKERDIKWYKPWKLHKEMKHIIKPKKNVESVDLDHRPNLFSFLIELVMGYENVPRDPKFLKPWKSHPEFQSFDKTVSKKDEHQSTMFDSFIRIVFNLESYDTRDKKWSIPWKKHKGMKILSKPNKSSQSNNSKVSSVGILGSVLEFIMSYEKVPRDPKFAKHWKTHNEFQSQEEKSQITQDKEQDGIFDMFVQIVFNLNPNTKRDKKWSKSWKSHKEMKLLSKLGEKERNVDQTKGLFSFIIEYLIGYEAVPRDPKFNKPWKTHSEFQGFDKKSSAVNKNKVESKLFDSIIRIIFNLEPYTTRDKKWLKPWKKHKDMKLLLKTKNEDGVKNIEKESSSLLNLLIEYIIGYKEVPRDPKYLKHWKTHPEFSKQQKSSNSKKEDDSLNIWNTFIGLLFNVEINNKRDSKWTKPWKSHKEYSHIRTKPEYKTRAKSNGNELVNSIIQTIMGKIDKPRDSKYKTPWRSHPEFQDRLLDNANEKRQKSVSSGNGIFNNLVYLIFNIDSSQKPLKKWSVDWKTHKDFKVKKKEFIHKTEVGTSENIFTKIINFIFNTEKTPRDKKYFQSWKTHPEFIHLHGDIKRKQKSKDKVESAKSSRVHSKNVIYNRLLKKKVINKDIKNLESLDLKNDLIEEIEKNEIKPSVDQVNILPKARPSKSETKITKYPFRSKKEKTDSPKEKATKNKFDKPVPKKHVSKNVASEKIDHTIKNNKTKSIDEDTSKKQSDTDYYQQEHRGQIDKNAPSADLPPVTDTPKPAQRPVLEEVEKIVEKVAPQVPIEEEEEPFVVTPSAFRTRDHIESILGLDESSRITSSRTIPIADATLKDLKRIYDTAIKPLETTYKYQDISNRHVTDAEMFGTPMILLIGPYSTGKSSFINYLLGIEYTKRALRTGLSPSHGVFRIIQHGLQDRDLDGTDLSAHWAYTSLQKFGQNFIDQLRSKELNVPFLKKATLVEAPGILEMRRPGERLYPYNDVVQWFIDRADLILVMFDYTKLDAGYELEAILDQLKGREAQTRILLNKADQIPPEELIKVQGSLFWNLSPLLGISAPPTVYAGSFTSLPYRPSSPVKLFQAQEEALMHDINKAINSRVDNRIAIARRHAVRVRNHAQMVDTYLLTYYKNKGFLTSKHKLADDIIENPHLYNIYEGMSLLTNISRYDLPDPEVYRDFFRVHNLYDFPTLRDTCSWGGCPLDKIDRAVSKELHELLARYRRLVDAAMPPQSLPDPPTARGSVGVAGVHSRTS